MSVPLPKPALSTEPPKEQKPRVNGNEIRFFIPPDLAENQIQVENTMKRLARLTCFSGDKYCHQKEDGYRWQLDDSNDWWTDIGSNGDAPNEIVLAYRYAGYPGAEIKLANLRNTIIWILGFEEFNKEETTK